MVLKKYRLITVSVFKIFAEILYEILKKFAVLYYMIFILGLLFSIKNNNITKEVVLISTFFLIFTWGYCKMYSKVKVFLNDLEFKLK
ncbi:MULTISPECIES: hypothetical protein [Cetobacterium]|jgi:hypothetical protein|uniref:Uncharacterized protein n=1 Tax=Candidatus Cetobacterium colombiensis TaxID=3073100 RepID=A0ABU4WAL1_9FUSO|nr:hypothetical protein [Candidatus Cetobacterium colombiensis]MDX8335440.1 hypothetical protein [Candidatus Cetobacterium colombiensis]